MIRKSVAISDEYTNKFISLEGERLLLATRTHWFVLLPPFLFLLILSIVGTVFFYISAPLLSISSLYSLLFTMLLWLWALIAFGITLIRWYLHIYLVTTRKILEVRSLPFFFHDINDVLLDQVRCTEIDIKKSGMINELLDMGDVIITFDRPTHRDAFILSDLHDPESVGIFLGDKLDEEKYNVGETVWYKNKNDPQQRFRFTDQIFPKYSV